MRNILLAVVAAAGLVGCVGGIDSTSGDDGSGSGSGSGSAGDPVVPGKADQAKPLFDANIYPILSTKCISCHKAASPLPGAPGFVAATLADGYSTAHSYGALVGDITGPASATPILKIIAAGHNGVVYSPDDITKITDWLAAELAAKNAGAPVDTTSPGAIITRLQQEWSGCMTLTNFTTAKMVQFANLQTNDGNGNATCGACHDNAEYNMLATTLPQKFFDGISKQNTLMSQYFTVDSVTAPTKMIVNEVQLQLVAKAAAPHIGHRPFNLTNSQALTALKSFYDLTAAAKAAGTCGPSVLTN
jgi:hypothetical protein